MILSAATIHVEAHKASTMDLASLRILDEELDRWLSDWNEIRDGLDEKTRAAWVPEFEGDRARTARASVLVKGALVILRISTGIPYGNAYELKALLELAESATVS